MATYKKEIRQDRFVVLCEESWRTTGAVYIEEAKKWFGIDVNDLNEIDIDESRWFDCMHEACEYSYERFS